MGKTSDDVFFPAAFVIYRKIIIFTIVKQSAVFMKTCLYLFTALFLITACSSDYLASIHTLEKSVCDNPQGVVDSLTLMKPDYPRMTAKEQAYYSLIYAMALDKSYIDTTDVSILDPAVKYYSKHGTPREKMLTYYYLGRIQGNARQYSESLISLTKALEQDWDDNAYRGRAFMAMADAYIANYNYQEESRSIDSASVYYKATNDSSFVRVVRFRKATNYINLGRVKEAYDILDELLQHQDLEYHIKRNCLRKSAYSIALLDYDSLFTKALARYNESIEMGLNLNSVNAAAYAYLLHKIGKQEDANRIFVSLEAMGGIPKAEADSWRSRIYYDEGKIYEAFRLKESALAYQDSIVISTLNQSLVASQRDYYSDEALREQQYSNLLKSRQVVLVLTIIIIGIVLISLVIVVRHRSIKKVSQYESALEELKNELSLQISKDDSSQKQISSLQAQFKRVYKHHFDLLTSFYEEYDIMRRNGVSEDIRNSQVLKIISLLQGETESDNRFEKIVDEDMNGILTHFRSDYPNFSEIDYRLFCYYVAGFSTKTISIIIKGLSADAIYMRKSRMKRIIENSDETKRNLYLEFL